MTYDELDGTMSKDGYSFKYTGTATKPEGMQALFDEVKSLEKQVKEKNAEILALAIKSVRLPANFKIVEVNEGGGNAQSFAFKANAGGMTLDTPPPKPYTPPQEETDPYKRLFMTVDIKHILHSNFLSREEKRKVLGLPPQTTEGEKNDQQ